MNSFLLFHFTFLTLLGFIMAYVSIWILLSSSAVTFFIDNPGDRKVHQTSVPRAGGVCVLISFLLLFAFWQFGLSPLIPRLPWDIFAAVIISSIGIFLIGFIDDSARFEISNKSKFLVELLIASLVVFVFKIQIREITLWSGMTMQLGWVGLPLSILWIVGVTNAFNIIDGIDGLAASIIFISLTTIGFLSLLTGEYAVAILCSIGLGLTIGFLLHNAAPARVFWGDTGSLFFGMIISILALRLVSLPQKELPVIVAPLIVGFPILDVFAAMTRRYVKAVLSGEGLISALGYMTVADNEHIHHRLVFRGIRHPGTCLLLAMFAATLGLTAVAISLLSISESSPSTMVSFLVGYLIFVIMVILWNLNFFDRFIMFASKRYRKKMGAEGMLAKVGVVNADDVLHHSLVEYNQDLLYFQFLSREDLKNITDTFAAIIINNAPDDDLNTDITLAKKLVISSQCPVIIAADISKTSAFKMNDNLKGITIFINKPLYIPMLLREVYPLVKSSQKLDAFENAFSKEAEELPIF